IGAGWVAFETKRALDGSRSTAAVLTERYESERKARQALESKPASVPIFPLLGTRDAGASEPANQVRLPASSQWIVLALDRAGLPEFPQYRGQLADAEGHVIREFSRLEPVSREAIGVSVNASLLTPGTYVLTVEGIAAGGRGFPAGRYSFRVTA